MKFFFSHLFCFLVGRERVHKMAWNEFGLVFFLLLYSLAIHVARVTSIHLLAASNIKFLCACFFINKRIPRTPKKYHNRCFIPYEPTKKWLLHWIILYIIVRNMSKENYCRLAVRGIAPTIFLYHPDQLVPRFIPLWYFSPAFLPSLRSAYWMPHGKFLQIKDSMCSEANSFFETSTSSLVAKREAFASATCLWRESSGSEIYLWKVMFSRATCIWLKTWFCWRHFHLKINRCK